MKTATFVSRRRALSSTFALGLTLGVVGAGAAEPGRHDKVGLAVSDCPDSFERSLRRILAIELGDLLDEAQPQGTNDRERIEIACDGNAARISARAAAGEPVAHNDLAFDAFPPDAAPRAVALAALEALRAVDPTIAERLEAQRAGGESQAPPPPAPSGAPAGPRVRPVGKRTDEELSPVRGVTRVTLGGITRLTVAAPATAAFGARAELSRRFAAPFDAGVDLELTFARRRVDLGTVEAAVLSTAAWLGARAGGDSWSATAGLGARLGLAALRGAPMDAARGHRIMRPVGGPLLMLRGDGWLAPLAVALLVEGGVAAVGAEGTAGGQPAIALRGAWVAACASVGIGF